MLHVTVPSQPEALSYSVLAVLVVEMLLVIVLGWRGEWLGALLVMVLFVTLYWFVCRQLVAVVTARSAVAAGVVVAFIAGLIELTRAHPYTGLLFMLAAIVLGFAFALLQQGAVPVELRLGTASVIGRAYRGGYLRMLVELRDAGLLTEGEFAAKRSLLSL